MTGTEASLRPRPRPQPSPAGAGPLCLSVPTLEAWSSSPGFPLSSPLCQELAAPMVSPAYILCACLKLRF